MNGGGPGLDAFCEHPVIYGGGAGALVTGGSYWGGVTGAVLGSGYCDDYANKKAQAKR